MKRIIAILIATIMILSVVSCSKNQPEDINQLIIGEWVRSYTATKDDVFKYYRKGDKLLEVLIIRKGGSGEKYTILERDRNNRDERFDLWSFEWSLEDYCITTHSEFMGISKYSTYTVDLAKKMLHEAESGFEYQKVE